MPTEPITWIALSVSLAIAAFVGILLWHSKEPPSGAFLVFAVFAGLPVLLTSLPEIVLLSKNFAVETPEGTYRVTQLEEKIEAVGETARSAEESASRLTRALEQAIPPLPITGQTRVQSSAASNRCRPYLGGGEPPPGVLVTGSNEDNWFPVLTSFPDEISALVRARQLLPIDSTYPIHVYKAWDATKQESIFALTLGGYLSQNEAIARVCYAQKSTIFPKEAFVWASNRWGSNLLKEE